MFDLTNPKHLYSLFASSGRKRREWREYRSSCDPLAYCVAHRVIQVTKVRYTKYPRPAPTDFAKTSVYEWAGKGYQTKNHQSLKWYAWNWCVENFSEAPLFEKGARDLVSLKHRVWIECGDTNPSHAFHYFVYYRMKSQTLERYWRYFVLFPFDSRFPLADESSAFIFEPSEFGEKVLLRYAEWVRQCNKREADERQGIFSQQLNIPEEPFNLGLKYPIDYNVYSLQEDYWDIGTL